MEKMDSFCLGNPTELYSDYIENKKNNSTTMTTSASVKRVHIM